MPTVLITGANRGLGLEFARQYVADGWRVIATCRDPAKAEGLRSLGSAVEIHALDVTDFTAIGYLAQTLDEQPIDLLIANAGVIGSDRNLGDLTGERWMQTLRVNTVAPILLAQALLPSLRAGAGKTAVFLTSLMGSIDDNGSGRYYDYRSSKAGLNAAVKSLAIDLKGDAITAIVIHPGWVKTDMGGAGAPLEAPASVGNMRKTIAKLKQGDSGHFFNHDGKELRW